MTKARTGPGHLAGATFLLADAERLVRAVEAAGAGLWEWDLADNVINVSAKLAAQLGLAPRNAQITPAGFFECLVQDDIALFRVALAEALHDDRPFVHEARVGAGRDREICWLSFRGQVLERSEDGEVLVLAGLCLDVTDQRRTREAYDLLNRELSHRMKNLLSVVGSLVNMTSAHRPEARDFVMSFQTRLNTFAAAHEFLMQAEWQAIPLDRLVEKALSPLGVWDRIDVRNTRTSLSSHDAQTIVLVLHELATNAIKYGALSTGTGRVELSFDLEPSSSQAGPVLVMGWAEKGGPKVLPPRTRGFGIRLIERLTKRQSSGRAVLDWRPGGLHCCIELPLTPPRH